MTSPPPLSTEMLASLPESVQLYIRHIEALDTQLAAHLSALQARVAELEARIPRNSKNSSRPPSSDGPQVKRGVPRPPSRRPRGGQEGHPKHDRAILPPDEVIDHKPSRCDRCDAPLSGDDPKPIIEQVIDLPPVMRRVIHHRRHAPVRPHCRTRTTAAPVPEAACGFGPGLQAAAAYLSGVGRLGKRAVARAFGDLFGVPMALGGVSKLEARTGAALESIHDEAHAHTRGRDADVDETGWKQAAGKAWLRAAVTRRVTVFLIRRRRDRGAFDELVGPNPGVMTTDRFSVYSHLPPARRQVCWTHPRRDFQAMIDRRDEGSTIGEELLLHADVLTAEWIKVREGRRGRAWFGRAVLPWLREEVARLLRAGSGCGGVKTARVCRELLGLEPSLWTFATTLGVEPTNDAAERAVRRAVCWRKTSYGTDGERGSRYVERMLTVVESCRSQGRNVLTFLTQAITAHQRQSAKPSLLPEWL